MLKIALGLTSGIVLGVAGTFIALMMTVIVLEESPELLETLKK